MTVRVTAEHYGYQVHGQSEMVTCRTLTQVKRYVRGIGEREFDLHYLNNTRVKRVNA